MICRKPSPRAYQLFHEGALALARVERNGVKVDESYLTSTIADVTAKVKTYEDQIRADPFYREWHKMFGERTNLNSRERLGKTVFDRLGYQPKLLTETGRYSTEAEAFEHVGHPMVKV